MRKKVCFENIEISNDNCVLVIPEIGINHNGSLKTAKEMVDAAYRAGARLIKHQTHVIEDEMSKLAKQVIPGNSTMSIYDIMSSCALNEEEEYELKRYVESLEMCFLSTPFSRAAADRLEKFGVSAYKIGSGEMNNLPLVDYIASFGKPMIISTGMNSISEIAETVNILEKHNASYALMHTTNLYPTLPEQVRLNAMREMMEEFPDIPIGLSDHTVNNLACLSAMTLGANLVERHFVDSKKRNGPDVVCSMDEKELKELLLGAKSIPLMLRGEKKPLPEEKVTIDFAFATVVSIQDIGAGEMFTKENIWVKRPGLGEISAKEYEHLIGKKAKCTIKKDEHIRWSMINE